MYAFVYGKANAYIHRNAQTHVVRSETTHWFFLSNMWVLEYEFRLLLLPTELSHWPSKQNKTTKNLF